MSHIGNETLTNRSKWQLVTQTDKSQPQQFDVRSVIIVSRIKPTEATNHREKFFTTLRTGTKH
jgi:hypothetical protein